MSETPKTEFRNYKLSYCTCQQENENTEQALLSEPDFYGDLVYKLKTIVGSDYFSAQFIK